MPSPADHCPDCLPVEEAPASSTACLHERAGRCLRDFPEGTQTYVREVRGCERLRSRLCSLGFTPGVAITICGRGEAGCRVAVRDTWVVLDRESAESIVCGEAREYV